MASKDLIPGTNVAQTSSPAPTADTPRSLRHLVSEARYTPRRPSEIDPWSVVGHPLHQTPRPPLASPRSKTDD